MRTDDLEGARRLGLVIAALLLAIVMSLASCGPGVVGTGSGSAPVPLADAQVCSADFAASLSCPPANGNATMAGTDATTWSDAGNTGADATVSAVFTGNDLVLEQPCVALRFEGRFTLLEGGQRAFAGTYVDSTSAQSRTGFVFVTPEAGDPLRLSLRLVDAEGVTRHGPWVLRPASAGPIFAACS